MKTLSICIGTYNRKEELKELVGQILMSDNDDFIVEITDNCSTDGTIDMLNAFGDARIVIHQNQNNIGGHNNMVKSIFNCSSRYALYLNDREIFDGTRLDALVSILNDTECSYLYCTRFSTENRRKTNAEYSVNYFASGVESFKAHGYAHHPSGMVYNSELIKKYLKYEDYQSLGGNFKFSMVACDLMALGKTALIDIGIWNERPEEYIRDHISGFETKGLKNPKNCYFHPYQSEIDVKVAINHILINKSIDVDYNSDEIIEIATGIVHHHFMTLFTYKPIMFSPITCGHYNLRRQFISTKEMMSLYDHFYKSNIEFINSLNLPNEVMTIIEEKKNKEKAGIVINSLKNDVAFLLHKK